MNVTPLLTPRGISLSVQCYEFYLYTILFLKTHLKHGLQAKRLRLLEHCCSQCDSPLSAVHSLVYLSCLLSRQVSNNSPHQLHIGPRDCYLSVIKLLGEALLTAPEELKNVKHLNDLVNLTQAETYASVN